MTADDAPSETATPATPSTVDRTYRINDRDISFRCFETGPSQLVSHLILSGETYSAPPVSQLIPARRDGSAERPIIVDIGANIGASSAWFAANYPDATIHAVEPSPVCQPLLTHNLANHGATHIHPIGLGDADGTGRLYDGVQDPVTGSLTPSALTSEAFSTVEICSVTNWLATSLINRIDLLKIDTEGAEVAILTSLVERRPALTAQISVIHLEFHSEADRRVIDQLLAPTHSLTSGTVHDRHRGELTYSSHRFLARVGNADAQKIEAP